MKMNMKDRMTIRSAVIALITLGTLLVVRTDENPIGLRVHELVDTVRHRAGTMNGFFVSDTDAEACVYFEQTKNEFEATYMSDMASSFFKSISGTFTRDDGGVVTASNGEGDPLPLKKFSLSTEGEREMFRMSPARESGGMVATFFRTSRGKCKPKFDISCIGLLEQERDLGWFISDDMISTENQILGKWKMNRFGGHVVISKLTDERSGYHLEYSGLSHEYVEFGELFLTKKTSDGKTHGIVELTLRGGEKKADHRVYFDADGKTVFTENCDHSPTSWYLKKVERQQVKSDL